MQDVLKERIEEIEKNKKKIQDYLADKRLSEHFWNGFYILFSWTSNSIEGNTLSLNDTIKLIEYNEVSADKPMRDHEDVLNHHRATRQFLTLEPTIITETWIKKMHETMMRANQNKNPGEYRDGAVFVGNAFEIVYQVPHHEKVPSLMETLVARINDNAAHKTLEMIMKDHVEFESIHPFYDGNGRVGRIILNQQLINAGYLPVAIKRNSKYIAGIKRYQDKKDIMPLMSCITIAQSSIWVFLQKCYRDVHPTEKNNISMNEGPK